MTPGSSVTTEICVIRLHAPRVYVTSLHLIHARV